MADYSQYKNLELPKSNEKYDISVANKNNMVIDSELHKLDLKNESQDNLLATKKALNSEITRATTKENEISQNLNDEISRAMMSEKANADNIIEEINRAITAEQSNNDNLISHNTSDSAHSDIRSLISGLTTRLNALADSDDTTLDQLSEIVGYIKNNKNLIDGITTNKISISDVIDNLTSTNTDKPLSANQGNILKQLIESLTKSDIGLENVENKSSATIREELTKENVTNALGYIPSKANIIFGMSGINTTSKKISDIYSALPNNSIWYYSTGNENDPIFTNNTDFLEIVKKFASVCGVLKIEKIDSARSHIEYTQGLSVGTLPIKLLIGINSAGLFNSDNVICISNNQSSASIIYSDSQPTTLTTGITWIGK